MLESNQSSPPVHVPIVDAGISDSSGVSIVGKQICYSVITKAKNTPEGGSNVKSILKNVDVCVRRGKVTAVMGPSGSGKTSLLNILAGRLGMQMQPVGTDLEVSLGSGLRRSKRRRQGMCGEILYNGNSDYLPKIGSYSSYVMQSDTLLEFLTVEETIRFVANLKLRSWNKADREKRIDEVIRDLGLTECRDVLIGGEMKKGVSGGQKRRVSIGVEILDEPELIFLDEPTSGLDAALAFDVIQVLSNLAEQGRSVVLTIHQPRYQTFALLDDLILLNDGELVYQGDASNCLSYFQRIGHPCPEDFNPADFILDILTVASDLDFSVEQSHRRVSKRNSQELPTVKELEDPQSETLERDTETETERERERQRDRDRERELSKLDGSDDQGIDVREHLTIEEIHMLPIEFEKSSSRLELTLLMEMVQKDVQLMKIKNISEKNRVSNWFLEFRTLCHRCFLCNSRDPITTILTFCTLMFFGSMAGGIFWMVATQRNGCLTVFGVLGICNFTMINLTFNQMAMGLRFPEQRPLFNRERAERMYGASSFFCAKVVADFPFQEIGPFIYGTLIFWMTGMSSDVSIYFIYALFSCMAAFLCVSFSFMIGALAPNFPVAIVLCPNIIVFLMYLSGFMLSDDQIPSYLDWLKWFSWMRYEFIGLSQNVVGEHIQQTDVCFYLPENLTMWENMAVAFGMGIGFKLLTFIALKYCHTKIGLEA